METSVALAKNVVVELGDTETGMPGEVNWRAVPLATAEPEHDGSFA